MGFCDQVLTFHYHHLTKAAQGSVTSCGFWNISKSIGYKVQVMISVVIKTVLHQVYFINNTYIMLFWLETVDDSFTNNIVNCEGYSGKQWLL
jgi:hypothetical protein